MFDQIKVLNTTEEKFDSIIPFYNEMRVVKWSPKNVKFYIYWYSNT